MIDMIKTKKMILLLIILIFSMSICVATDSESINQDTCIRQDTYIDSFDDEYDNFSENDLINRKEDNSYYAESNLDNQPEKVKNIKTANQEKKITINEINFNNYFRNGDGYVSLDKTTLLANRDYVYLINYLPENVEEIAVDITDSKYENNSIKFVGRNNITLNNCALVIESNVKNITIENFNFNFDENYLFSNFINVDNNVNLCVLNNISVNANLGNIPSQSYILDLNARTIVENSNITTKFIETNIDWYGPGDKIPQAVPIVVKSSDCLMNNNTIHVTSKGHRTEAYYSLYGVYIGGDNFTFTNNHICVDNATGYAYGFVDRSKNNLISDNFVEVYSEAYSAGINIEGAGIENNVVKNNRIHLVAGNDTTQAGLGNPSVAYAAEILDYLYNGGPYRNFKNSPKANNNSFINNTITGFARQFYGFEIFGGSNTLIENNTINSTGSTAMGIGAIGENVTMNNNIIEVRGKHNHTEDTVDYIVAMTAGIYTFYSSDGIKITNNTMIVEKGKGIVTANCENILIENNLITTEDYAYALEISGSNNTIQYNGLINDKPIADTIITTENNTNMNNREPINSQLTVNLPETFEVGKKSNITFTLKDELDNNLANQYIIITIDDEIIDTIVTDNDGRCNYEYTPSSTGTKSITADYTCYKNYGSSLSKDILVTEKQVIEPTETILKVDTTNFEVGQNTTITAKIYYGEDIQSNITKGKVSFKVNGKTLKDTNGKVIYAKVINGTATIENYPIPETWKEGSTIQAIYSGSTEVSKLTSEKQNITITQEKLTLTTEDKTSTTNTTITFKATLSDNTINTGKIVFKVNGKTVKDSNGKVIYAKVINGTASVEYTIPETMKTGNYTITVVFTAVGYDKLTDNKTLTVNA